MERKKIISKNFNLKYSTYFFAPNDDEGITQIVM